MTPEPEQPKPKPPPNDEPDDTLNWLTELEEEYSECLSPTTESTTNTS